MIAAYNHNSKCFARRLTHAPYDLLRGFRPARFEWSGLSTDARRAAAVGTTTGESGGRALVRSASAAVHSILRPGSIPVSCSGSRSVSCLEFHHAIAYIRVCRQRLAFPPAARIKGWHDVHRGGLLARRRSASLRHDRRWWNEVRAAHRAIRRTRCATDNRRECCARLSVCAKRRTGRAMA